ncbi:MAG: OmpH family outer membrane protein [Tannerellaceae bacterium]|jgi:outer membrane protein|nr:OmpH family outer membrane protein [Tannerellaceae bacterium]
MIKNIHYLIEGVLGLSIVCLFVMVFSGEAGGKEGVVGEGEVGVGPSEKDYGEGRIVPVAFIQVDSLLSSYYYAQDLSEIQLKNHENARVGLNQKLKDLETDAAEFQRKLSNNAFLSRERAQQEERRILQKQEELEQLRELTANELMLEQERMSKSLRDTIVSYLREYNEEKGFQLILSNMNGDNILLSEKAYDITKEVLEGLNKRYLPKRSKE